MALVSQRWRIRRSHGACSTVRVGITIFGVIGCLAAAAFLLPRPGATKIEPAAAPTVAGAVDPDARAAAVDAAVGAIDALNPDILESLYHVARDDVQKILSQGQESCENWRKAPNQQCVGPSDCGRGWLFQHKDLLLGVVVTVGTPGGNDNGDRGDDPATLETSEGNETAGSGFAEGESGTRTPEDGSGPGSGSSGATGNIWIPGGGGGGGDRDARRNSPPYQWTAGTVAAVNVVGLREGGNGEMSDCDSEDLSMLVRFQGPEALAEVATPITGRCAWTVQFRPTMEGEYTLDATLLNWRGGLEAHRALCNEVIGQYGGGSVEMDAVTGVPFYGGSEACCDMCTREEGCVAWSATNDFNIALVNGKRCVLFSSVVGDPVEDPLVRNVVRSGTPRREDSMVFLSPSMSIARRWCSDENGSVFGVAGGASFTIVAGEIAGEEEREQTSEEGEEQHGDSSSSSSATRSVPSDGRWVSLDDTECDFEPGMVDPTGWPKYDRDVFSVSMPEECFLKPVVPPGHGGELQFSRGGHVWQPYDCRYDLMDSEARLNCFRDKNITRFLDFGDSLISTSRMPRSTLWLPTADPSRWSTGRGAPEIEPGATEAGCVGGPIQYYGTADYQQQGHGEETGTPRTLKNHYCGVEAYWQAQPGPVRNLIKSFEPDVVVANWAMVHRLWHNTFEEFQGFLKELGRQLDGMAKEDKHRPRHMFWLSAPFLVSEREPHCVLERGLQYNEALRGLLEPRGWIEIDWVSMTRKWGVDILDGMHHGQPPTRMLAYVLMHHVCHAA
ncbi:unnamed protein product [Scytosiphon promiscuus]